MRNDILLRKPSEMFDTLLDDFFKSPVYGGRFSNDVALNMYEDGDDIVVEAKVAGYKEEDIDLSIEDDMLVISGSASTEKEEEDKKKKYYYKEMSSQSFSRSVSLPTRVDADNASAEVENGVLKIRIPKSSEVKPRKVNISTKKR